MSSGVFVASDTTKLYSNSNVVFTAMAKNVYLRETFFVRARFSPRRWNEGDARGPTPRETKRRRAERRRDFDAALGIRAEPDH